jgi:Flp pilus assembly protein TadD
MSELTPARRAQLRELENSFKTGLALHDAGRLNEAGGFYEKILEVIPDHAETLDLYGRLLFERGEAGHAVAVLRKAVTASPRSPSCWNHLGVASRATGDLEAAVAAFERTVELRADHVEAHLNLAVVLTDLGRIEAALPAAARAVELAPEHFSPRLRLGAVLRGLRRYEDAVVELRMAARLDPLVVETYLHLSACHGMLNRPDARRNAVRRGILVAPAGHEIHTHLGRDGPIGAAGADVSSWARRATRLRPSEHRMWDHLAALCHGENRFDETVVHARRSILLAPGEIASYNNLATGLFNTGAYGRSIWSAHAGLAVSPNFPELEFILCQSAFCDGQPDLAWRHWSSRYRLEEAPVRIGLPSREWRRGERPGSRLLVCAEQGVGDEILYFSCLPDLMLEVDDLVVECEPRWRALLERSLPAIVTVPRQTRDDPARGLVYDYTSLVRDFGIECHVPCGSLPEFYRHDVVSDPPRGGYLRADPIEADAWRRRLGKIGPGPFIGVCWRSGLTLTPQRTLYYPDAVELISQLPRETGALISLQYGELGDDLRRVENELGVRVHHFEDLDQTIELDRVAALMSCLDLVIAPSSTVCHLASSVGVATIAMDKSNFMCANERDPLFLNLYPVMRRNEVANPGLAASRTARAVEFFLDNGRLPRVQPGNS